MHAGVSLYALSSSAVFEGHGEQQYRIHGHSTSCCACSLGCARSPPNSRHHFDYVMSLPTPQPWSVFMSAFPVLRVFDIRGWFPGTQLTLITRVNCTYLVEISEVKRPLGSRRRSGNLILKCTFIKQDERAWTGLIWIWLGTTGWLL